MAPSTGPLAGVRVVELAGIGPLPFAAMMLADMGADVVRVDRVSEVREPSRHESTPHPDVVLRGRRSVAVDLKADEGRRVVLDLAATSDVLLEGFRPGVVERLGLGPDDVATVNPRLVFGRMTGWGQDGPLATTAGHDIDYIAITGALHGIRRAGSAPVPPLNLLGDLGGGATFLAFGVVCALLEARGSGRGQVVDASVVDGTSALTNFVRGLRRQGLMNEPPGHNVLDSGAPFYEVYECADGEHLAVGALEPRFHAELVRLAALPDPGDHLDPRGWRETKEAWARVFRTRTRAEWVAVLEGSDACAAPVLSWEEAPSHPHHAARGTFVERAGAVQAAPAPRFDRTAASLDRPPPWPGTHTDEVLRELGRDDATIASLRESGAVA